MKNGLIIFIIGLICISCTYQHRLRPKFYRVERDYQQELVSRESYYLDGFSIRDAYDANPLTPDGARVLVTYQTALSSDSGRIDFGILSVPGEIGYRIYVELPEVTGKDSIGITGRSICRIIGLYEMADSLKHFRCTDGYLLIDTVKANRFTAYLSARYLNVVRDSLAFRGRLDVQRLK